MSQFLFDAFTIIGGFLLALWGYFVAHKNLRKLSWWFLIVSFICFCIAIYNSYQRSKMEIKPPSTINLQQIQPKDTTSTQKELKPPISSKPKSPKSMPTYNPPKQTIPDLPVEKIIWVIKPISSTKPESPFALEIVIQTNVIIENPHFIIKCTDIIDSGNFYYPGANVYTIKEWSIHNNSYEFSLATPAFTPKKSLIVNLFSKNKIYVLDITHIL
ncbi:MAG: hypothetical protein JXR49_11900 [Acidobacteria bacterium]|nr:hypothetical protein [Acidobacteriota bacterium]